MRLKYCDLRTDTGYREASLPKSRKHQGNLIIEQMYCLLYNKIILVSLLFHPRAFIPFPFSMDKGKGQ